jgi:hypothetical protein
MRFPIALGLLIAAPLAANAQTLADALDACESFVLTGNIPETIDTEFTLTGDFDYGTMQTDVGPLLLIFAKESGADAVTSCDVTGADPRDKAGPIRVSWSTALPLIDPWFTARAARGGGKTLQVFGTQRMFAACTETAEYFITARSHPIVDEATALPEEEWPLVVRITEWTGSAARPCDL